MIQDMVLWFQNLTPEHFLFLVISLMMVLSSVLMVNSRHPIYSAIFMIVTMFGIAACFVLLDSYFLGVIQVLVYAGAIMVLFLFIIMLLNVDQESAYQPNLGILGILLSAFFAGKMWNIVWHETSTIVDLEAARTVAQQIEIRQLARILLEEQWFAFEAVSMLLLSAILGVVVLSKRRLE